MHNPEYNQQKSLLQKTCLSCALVAIVLLSQPGYAQDMGSSPYYPPVSDSEYRTVIPYIPAQQSESQADPRFDNTTGSYMGNRSGLRSRSRSSSSIITPTESYIRSSDGEAVKPQPYMPNDNHIDVKPRLLQPQASSVAKQPARPSYKPPVVSYQTQPLQIAPDPAPIIAPPAAVVDPGAATVIMPPKPVVQTASPLVDEVPAPPPSPPAPAVESTYTPPADAVAVPPSARPEPIPVTETPALGVVTPAAPTLQEEILHEQTLESFESNTVATPPAPPIELLPQEAYTGEVVQVETPAQPAVEEAPTPVAVPSQTQNDDGHKVKYFDATVTGTAPTFEESGSAIPVEEVVPPPQDITPETRMILNSLPQDVFPDRVNQAGAFDMTRTNPTTELPEGVDFKSSDSIGADIAVKQQSIDINYELEKAYNALLQGGTEVAIGIYKQILTIEPNNKNALFGLATTYHKLGMLDEARPVYGKLIELDPYNREALNNFLGLVGEEAPESAILYLEQLKVNNSDFSPVYAQLAQLYTKQGNMQQAISNMQQAVAISPENLIYKYNLAVLYDMHRDYRNAEILYRQLIKAGLEGEEIPASISDIQERLTFLSSNKSE